MPEYGRTSGGVISAVTKSGGNEFHGSVFGTFTPGALTGPPGTVARRDAHRPGEARGRELRRTSERRWAGTSSRTGCGSSLASSGRPSATSTAAASIASSTGQTEAIPNSTQRRNGDERSINYIGKLTYLISSDHRVSLTVTGTPTTGGGEGGVALRNQIQQSRSVRPTPADPRHLQFRLRPDPSSTPSTSPGSSTARSWTSGCSWTCGWGRTSSGTRTCPGTEAGWMTSRIERPGGRPPGPLTGRRPTADLRAGRLRAGSVRTACSEPRSILQRGPASLPGARACSRRSTSTATRAGRCSPIW